MWHAVVNDVSELSYISKDNKTALIEQARLGFIEYLENDPEVMSSYQILKGVVLNKTPETMDEILALFSQNEHSLEQIDAQSWATMTDQEKKIIGYSFMQNIVLIERSDVYHHSAYSPAIQSQILRLFTTIDQLGGDVLSIFPDWHADRNIYNVDIPAHILDAVKSGWFEYGD